MSVQLGLGLNRRQGGFNPFTPTHLNPYLLFDTRTSMLGELESPTLDLDAAVPSSLDVITATRSGVATYTDINGTIQTADPNTVRVDYVQGEELTPTKYQRVDYTDFSSGWQSLNNLSVTSVDDFQGQPAVKLTTDGVTLNNLYQDTITTEDGVTYTGSFYIRRISGSSQPSLRHAGSASGNLTSITVTTEWTRVSVSFLGRSGGGSVYFGFIQYVAGDDVYEITQPQFEEGTTASDFVPNTTGSPKFIASATYGPRVPMMLIEPSATNLVDNSTTFSTTGSVTQQSGIDAPDGTNTATRISNISGAPAVDALYSVASSITPSAEITGSIFLRGEAGKVASLYVKRYGSGAFSSTPAESVLLTGEWQRYESPSFTLNADNANAAVTIRNDAVTTADTIDVWGGQIEVGTLATSFIPTSGSAVTRNADNLVIDGTAFSDFFNSGGDGTFYIEFTTKNILDPQTFILVGHSGSQRYFYTNATDPRLLSYDGTFTSRFGGGSIQTTLNRAALSYNSSIAKSSLNGATDASVSHSGALSNATELNIGSSYEDALHLNGHIRRILYWPTHSDNL